MDGNSTIKILEILEKVKDEQSEIKVTLERNTVSLEEHVRRTLLLEKAIIPLQERKHQIDGVMKLIVSISIIVGIIAAIVSIFK